MTKGGSKQKWCIAILQMNLDKKNELVNDYCKTTTLYQGFQSLLPFPEGSHRHWHDPYEQMSEEE